MATYTVKCDECNEDVRVSASWYSGEYGDNWDEVYIEEDCGCHKDESSEEKFIDNILNDGTLDDAAMRAVEAMYDY